jgi:hypothetical protein
MYWCCGNVHGKETRLRLEVAEHEATQRGGSGVGKVSDANMG